MFLFGKKPSAPSTTKVEYDPTSSNGIITCEIRLTPPSGQHFNLEAPGEFAAAFSSSPPSPEWKEPLVQDPEFTEHVAKATVKIDQPANQKTAAAGLQVTVTYFLCSDDMSNCFPPTDLILNFDLVPVSGGSGKASVHHQL